MVKKKQKASLKTKLTKNILRFFVSSCLIFACVWQYSQNRTTSLQYLDQQGTLHTLNLPVKDKKKLSGLMQKLFAEDNFAYTVLGPKPVSWVTYQNPLPLTNWSRLYNSLSRYHRTIRYGWKTWEKYQHLFPTALFWAENSKDHPGWVSILIVNKDRFNDVILKNKKDFQEVLSREIVDGFQLIREARNHSLMDEVLGGHQGLIGIVLGYGRDNSWKFLEGYKNHTAIGCVWDEEDDSTEDSLDSNAGLTDYYLSYYSCPSFAGDPNSAESLMLKSEYILIKKKLVGYYKDKDFLEATLSLLAGYCPK